MPWITPFNALDAGAALKRDKRTRNRVAAAVEAASGQSVTLSRDPASMTPPALPACDCRRGDRRRKDRRRREEAVILDTRCETDRRSGKDRRQDRAPAATRSKRFDDYA